MELSKYQNKICEVLFKNGETKNGRIIKVGNIYIINGRYHLRPTDVKKVKIIPTSSAKYKVLENKKIEEHIYKQTKLNLDSKENCTVFRVKYTGKANIVRSFSTLKEAQDFKAICEDNINYFKYKQSAKELDKVVIKEEYPDTLLNKIGITDDKYENYYTEIVPQFDNNFDRAKTYLTSKEELFIVDYYKNEKTFKSIAKENNLSSERVRQIIVKGLKRLSASSVKSIFLQNNDKMELIRSELYEQLKKEISYEIALEIIEQHQKEEEEKNPYINDTIVDLDLTCRTYNCLVRSGIKTVSQLCELTIDQVIKIKNLGKKSFKELREKLAERGLSFSGNEEY